MLLCCLFFFNIPILITPLVSSAIVSVLLQYTDPDYPFGIFGHCICCSSIYGSWLPLWYLRPLIQSRLNHSVKYFQYYKYEHAHVLTVNICQEEFEDTRGVIRIGISKKNRYNGRRYQRGNQDRYIEEEQTTQ